MNRWIWTGTLIVLLGVAGGCKKQAQLSDQDAIRASIEKHLTESQGLNLSAMDREMRQVTLNGDHATAQVEFRLKGGDARMDVEYSMERQGGEWKVLSSHPLGAPGQDDHPGTQEPPGGEPGGGPQ